MHIAFWILAYVWKSADWIFFFSLSGHMYKNLLAMSLFFFLVGHMHGNLPAMSFFFCSLGHMHGNLSAMSLFFCFPGHICQKKRYMSHCRRHKGYNAKEWFYMSHCAKKARHNRAKIFYMSPGSPCLLPFFVCHGLLPADMRLVALFAHENFGNLTLCCFWNSFFFVVRRWLFIPTRGASCNVYWSGGVYAYTRLVFY